MNAPARHPLSIKSMTLDMLNDPTLAVEVITGARQTIEADGRDADWLWGLAVDAVKDDDDLIDMGLLPTDGAIGIYKRIAARDALEHICNEQDASRQAEERRMEDGADIQL